MRSNTNQRRVSLTGAADTLGGLRLAAALAAVVATTGVMAKRK
jgi:hypothetical protein